MSTFSYEVAARKVKADKRFKGGRPYITHRRCRIKYQFCKLTPLLAERAATAPSLVVKEGYYTNPVWWGRSYEVSPDGRSFLMIKEGGPSGTAPPASLVVVQHWIEC